MRPAITGDTENGRSINVISTVLPRNSYLAIAQAAATPKATLAGTAVAATTKVSRIAANPSGSAMPATNAPAPLRNASVKTTATGNARKTVTNTSAIAMRITRAALGSAVGA